MLVKNWPNKTEVEYALKKLAKKIPNKNNIIFFGYFGSYSSNNWQVGSDIDLIAIIKKSNLSFEKRPLDWDLLDLPVPADILIYTIEEWTKMKNEKNHFVNMIEKQAIWIIKKK